MNNYEWLNVRERRKHLFIVEGNHEKNEFMNELLTCFPEIDINLDDVIIYGTNIYHLYDDIEKEYADGWWTQDIDLPMIVSNKKDMDNLYKSDFMNILLVFDYERHDPKFSEEKIQRLQNYFNDVADVGQLYLNYPMMESYLDFIPFPDTMFLYKQTTIDVQTGSVYKNSIEDSYIAKLLKIPKTIRGILIDQYSFNDPPKCERCVRSILSIPNTDELISGIEKCLLGRISPSSLMTVKHKIIHILNDVCLVKDGESYSSLMKDVFKYIICENVRKSYYIQNEEIITLTDLDKIYDNIMQDVILDKQNKLSRDNLMVWVLNTCLLFVPEYNIELLK